MNKEKKEASFEENLEKLENIVKKLEGGEVPLDDAIAEFTLAMQLAKSCDEKLKNAEESIAKLVNENGTIDNFEVSE